MNLWDKYSECPVCGKLHDDGVFYDLQGKIYYLCLDCSESMTKDEVIQAIERKEEKHEYQ